MPLVILRDGDGDTHSQTISVSSPFALFEIEPLNRHVLLNPVEKQEEQNKSTILVPDDYVQVKSPYETYSVISVARDCEKVSSSDVGRHVVVNNSMVEEVKVHGETHYLLLENYVYGVIQ